MHKSICYGIVVGPNGQLFANEYQKRSCDIWTASWNTEAGSNFISMGLGKQKRNPVMASIVDIQVSRSIDCPNPASLSDVFAQTFSDTVSTFAL